MKVCPGVMAATLVWVGLSQPTAAETVTARGRVFHDENANQAYDPGERLLSGVRVSNGREIVVTDRRGNYQIKIDSKDAVIFVIKPSGWRTVLSHHKLPRFYYIHKPAGSRELKYAGMLPTGPLPSSVDFPLYPQKEPRQFHAILFADPQPRTQQEVDFTAHDIVEELFGTKASFGVTLGDIVFDDLDLLEPQARMIGLLGIPWYNVVGNHDINKDARDDAESDETFERVFGPTYYSFDHGVVHFLVLDDILWKVEEGEEQGHYVGGFGPDQLQFIRNDLAAIPEDQLVVLLMHVPLEDVGDRQELYRLIEKRPFSMSVSGHTHHHEHRFIAAEDGWQGAEPHHHVINVTASGSWWGGIRDERGIPHTMMSDGAPNGYSIIRFNGHRYTVDFKAASRPAGYQMRIHAPEVVSLADVPDTRVWVNVFNGSEKSTVQMRMGRRGPWKTIERRVEFDPAYVAMRDRELAVEKKDWVAMPAPKPSPHLWSGLLPAVKRPGAYQIQIQTTDMNGRVYESSRIIRVE